MKKELDKGMENHRKKESIRNAGNKKSLYQIKIQWKGHRAD
jgi:hypothetical protein